MWIIILLLIVSIAITAILSKQNRKWQPALIGLSLLLCASGIMWVIRTRAENQKQTYHTVWDESIGFKFGQAISQTGVNSGTVLLLDETIIGATNPLAEIHLQGFQAGLSSTDLSIVKLNAMDLSTLNELSTEGLPPEMTPQGPADISYAQLMEVIRSHDQVVALVSFVGLPASMSNRQLASLPPVYVYGLEQSTTNLLDDELLQIPSIKAIVRHLPSAQLGLKPKSKDLDDIFAENFQFKQSR
ncbi:hypothetical protein P3T73_09305 [Kiritimatiellota bacterium B12222]|nr:hypothetical protein P3T73_09305 [Kiritimatiellota bacterium B12222]